MVKVVTSESLAQALYEDNTKHEFHYNRELVLAYSDDNGEDTPHPPLPFFTTTYLCLVFSANDHKL